MRQSLRVSLLFCVTFGLLAFCVVPPSAGQSSQLSLAGSYETGIFDEGAAEIAAFDSATGNLFFVNADANEVVALDIGDPSSPTEVYTISVEDQVPGGSANSVDVYDGTIAVAVEADGTADNGFALFYDAADGSFLKQVQVGVLPDHVTFNGDGSAVVTANEGEPTDDYSADPEGSVSVVDLSGGVDNASVATAGFTDFNGQKDALRAEGVRLFGGVTPLTVTGFSDADPASITVQDASAASEGQWLTLDSDDDPIPYQIASIDGDSITFTDDFDGDTELNDSLGPASLSTGSSTVAQDVEPEYVAVKNGTAYVTLQENNAVAVVDISTVGSPSVTDIHALGTKDHSQMGNGLDPSGDDEGIDIRTIPLQGLYQPDAVTSITIGGTTYLLTANEGDAREYDALVEEVEVGDLQLDASLADSLQNDEILGETATTFTAGDTDGDGEVEELFAYGARSFSIWNPANFGSGTPLVYDSGDFFEQQTATAFPNHFNADNDEQPSFEGRSDNKGPEPEAVETGVIGGTPHAFVGLERIGGVMVFDLSDPTSPQFVQYVNNRDFSVTFSGEDNESPTEQEILATGDLGPESIVFIPAAESPAATSLVAVSNEVSGSVSLFQVGTPAFVTEVHYDNEGSDEGEFVEVAIPDTLTSTQADPFNVVLYNGSNQEVYNSVSVGDGSRTSLDGEPFDLVTLDIEGIQNGAPDGIALCRGGDVVTSGEPVFFSYEGTFTAADGCAAGMESVDIGVAEGSDTPVGQSLQLTGSANTFANLTWDGPFPETPGALRDGQSLPVELAAFEGSSTDNGTALTWRTATETNNAGFAVQRRGEAQDSWTRVGFVEGAGTTSEPQSYRFTDQGLPYEAKRLEYRLRQIDIDGSASYSETVTVERGVAELELLSTYPNPAQSQAVVRYAVPENQDVAIRLYDTLGRQVRTVFRGKQEGRKKQQIDLSGLSSGVFFLRLRAGGATKTQKLTVMR